MRICLGLTLSLSFAAPAVADNPFMPLTDAQVRLIQQAGQGCAEAYQALQLDDLSLAQGCSSPSLSLEIARPLIETGRMNGMVQACGHEEWEEHAHLAMSFARGRRGAEDSALHATYSAGVIHGFVSVQDGRAATACVDGDDFSLHFFGNIIQPLLDDQ